MELIDTDGKNADITISLKELVVLNNALNEVCNALDQFDFETRMGAKHSEVTQLLTNVGTFIDKLEGK